MRLSNLLLAASAAVLFAACQPSTDAKSANTDAPQNATVTQKASDNIPHAQLPDTVTPKGYRIDGYGIRVYLQ